MREKKLDISLKRIWRKNKRGALRIENGIKLGSPWFAWMLLMPAFLTWLVFWLYVNFDSIILSFTYDGKFSLRNYIGIINNFISSADSELGIALRNTVIYFFVNYFIVQTLNVLLAYFLYKKIKGYKFFRFFLYLPNLLAGAMLTTIYKELISYDGPIINFLYEMGIISKRLQLLRDVRTAMPMSVVFSLWVWVGGTMIYTVGAMSRIPQEVIEAAKLDGITPWQEFVHIILPLISGTLSTLYIIGAAGILSAGGATLFLTNGNYGTSTLTFWIFWGIYTGGTTNAGPSCALGILMTLITLPLTLFVRWLAGKISPEVSY